MTANQATDAVNNLYIQAKQFRAFAVQLEANPNDVQSSIMWHHMADHIFDAVNAYDSTINQATK